MRLPCLGLLGLTLTLNAAPTLAGDGAALGGLTFDAELGPVLSAAGDVDGDGDQDLVVLHLPLAPFVSLRLYRNRGDGTFDPPELVAEPPDVSVLNLDLQLAHLDDDPHLDILSLPGGVLLGDGQGGFGPPIPLDTSPVDQVFAISVGDLDADGRPDLVLQGLTPPSDDPGGFGQALLVYLGQPDGSFVQLPAQAPSQNQPMGSVTIVDLDLDGHADVVGRRNIDGTLQYLPGAGDGSLGVPVPLLALPLGTGLPAAFGDLDGDGRQDVALFTEGPGDEPSHLQVALGADGPSFVLQSPVPFPLPFNTSPELLRLADLDGDGDLDGAVSTLSPGGVWLFDNDGGGQLSVTGEFLPDNWSFGLDVVQLDGDAAAELVVSGLYTNTLQVLQGGPDSFVDLGLGGGGALQLGGSGSTLPGGEASLTLSGADGAPAAFLFAFEEAPTPFAGGVLVPAPGAVVQLGLGGVPLVGRWPKDLTPGTQVLVQALALGQLSNTLAVVAR